MPTAGVSRMFVLVGTLLLGTLAGCVAPAADSPIEGNGLGFTPCAHPFPCGDEWPVGLLPPFAAGDVVRLPLVGHDGVPLETFVHLPALPDGVRAPVILFSTPYPGSCPSNGLGRCYADGDDPATTSRIDIERLVSEGYAVVITNVRGTGRSGGCFTMGGLDEQRDQAALVTALAAEPWSNGRVAMIGHSYPSYTAWMAAIQAPPALKTIIVSGHMTDLFTFYHSPQGAATGAASFFQTGYSESLSLPPPAAPLERLIEDPMVFAGRACPEGQQVAIEPARGMNTDSRDATIWDTRRLTDSMGHVTAAMLSVSGFDDDTGHAYQDDDVWNAITSPKSALFGRWAHDLPPPEGALDGAPFGSDWYGDVLIPWLDFWLKGIGPAPTHLGRVQYEAGGAWRTSSAWPPAEAKEEILYLASGMLKPLSGGTSTTYRAIAGGSDGPACEGTAHMFMTEPLASPVTIAGNAFAYLEITSDQAGGVLALDLVELPDGFDCLDPNKRMTYITGAAANLRFHEGVMQAKDFPIETPTHVRFDFQNEAWTIPAGHRLGVWAGATGLRGYLPHLPHAPNIVIGAGDAPTASHIVLPVVEGTLGGSAPTLDYPPKPFAPSGSAEREK